MINVAYLDANLSVDQESPAVAAYNEAAVEWNRALYGALLIAPPGVASQIPQLDREVDRLLDQTVARAWTRTEFRLERAKLGRMAAEYLRVARRLAGLPDIELPSIWAWDDASATSEFLTRFWGYLALTIAVRRLAIGPASFGC